MHVIAGLSAGGAETQLVNLATAPRPGAPDALVVNLLPDASGPNVRRLEDAGIEVRHLGLSGVRSLLTVRNQLARLIRTTAPDIVQSWMYYADLVSHWAVQRTQENVRPRLYWNVRCSDMELRRYSRRLRLVVKFCAARSGNPDGVVVNSRAGLEVHARADYRPRAWHLIDNGIDVGRFAPSDAKSVREAERLPLDRPIAIHAARVDPMKDHATLLKVAEACPDWTFVAAGAGTEALNGPQNFRGLGQRPDMASLLSGGDVVLSTSAFGEGFSNALAEGMASGLIPVTTDVGDARRIVGETGYVVPPGAAPELIDALSVISSFSETERAAKRALARSRITDEFSLSRMVGKYDSLYSTGMLD